MTLSPSLTWTGAETGRSWIDGLPDAARTLVQNAARWQEDQAGVCPLHDAFAAMANTGDAKDQASRAKHFTPPDIALATASILSAPGHVFDPSAGKGSLLIAAGLILAHVHGLRGAALLQHLHGTEISFETREALVVNVTRALEPWTDLRGPAAWRILENQIAVVDFLTWEGAQDGRLHDKTILLNSPYKGEAKTKPWTAFFQRVLDAKPHAIAAILPREVTTHPLAEDLRADMRAYPSIRAIHIDLDPRSLAPGEDACLTLIALQEAPERYETTGVAISIDRPRSEIWNAPTTRFPWFRHTHFDKVGPADLPFYSAQHTGRTLHQIGDRSEAPVKVWIRALHREQIAAQRDAPTSAPSKWKQVRLSPEAAEHLLSAATDGTACRWGRVFGDGLDFPLKRFLDTWRPGKTA